MKKRCSTAFWGFSGLSALAATAAVLAGCGPAELPDLVPDLAPYGRVRLEIRWPDGVEAGEMSLSTAQGQVSARRIPAFSESLHVRISADDIPSPIERTLSRSDAPGDTTSVELRVPPGTGRTLYAEARDVNGDVLSAGASSFDVGAGQTTHVPVELQRGLADSAWPVAGGTMGNTHLSLAKRGNGGSGSASAAGPGGGITGITVGPGDVRYVCTDEGTVHAYGPGYLLGFKPPLWSATGFSPIAAPAVVGADGSVFVMHSAPAGFPQLRCYDRLEGARKWDRSLSGEANAPPSISPSGTVWVPQRSGRITGFDAATGNFRMQFPATGTKGAFSQVTAFDGHANAYICDDDGHLYSFDSETGDELWDFAGDGSTLFGPALGRNGLAYCATAAGRILAVSMDDGALAWAFPSEAETAEPFAASPALGPEGHVYIGGGVTPAHLYSIDGTDGSLIWRNPPGEAGDLPGSPVSQLVTSDGYLFAVFSNGTRSIYRAADGSLRSSSSGGVSDPVAPAMDSDGVAMVGDRVTGNLATSRGLPF